MSKLLEQLKRHEGFRQYPYKCTAGKLTIGVGRNLDDVGITEDEAMFLLRNDVSVAIAELQRVFPWVDDLDAVRADALVNLTFNMGISRLSQFKNMLGALKSGDYEKAGAELLDSRYATQVGQRANELAEQIVTGEYQF